MKSVLRRYKVSLDKALLNINNELIEALCVINTTRWHGTTRKIDKMLHYLEKDLIKASTKFQKRLRQYSDMEV